MPDTSTSPTLREWRNRILPLMRGLSEAVAIAMVRSIPLVGSALVIDRKTLNRLSALFENDDEIQRDIDKVVQNMSETEEIMNRLKTHVETRKNDLQQTLDEYNRFKELAAVEKKNAEPLLRELRREGNKGVIWGAILPTATNFGKTLNRELTRMSANYSCRFARIRGRKSAVYARAQYIINLAMVILGIILAHFLRIWLPGFAF